MRIFVTGGTGFLGSHFIREALARHHQVSALCRVGSRPRIKLKYEPIWINGGLDSDLRDALAGADCLIHLAAAGVSPQKINWADAIRWNVAGLDRLLDSAMAAGVRRIFVGGTGQEYGRAGDRFERIPSWAPLEPTGAYATSKAAASILAGAKAREYGLELAVLRPFHCFGEGQYEGNFWPALKHAALAGADFSMSPGEQVFDFCSAESVASQFMDAIESLPLTPGTPIVKNIGSGQAMRLVEFAQMWWRIFAAKGRLNIGGLPYRPAEIMRLIPDLGAGCQMSSGEACAVFYEEK